MRQYLIILLLLSITISANCQSPFIHVDQFGYTTNAVKVAVLSNPQTGTNSNLSYNPASSLELWEVDNNQLIGTYPPIQWNNGATHIDWSGDQGWWVDFSSVTSPGNYVLVDPQSLDSSAVFKIGGSSYAEPMKAATRMFYYNRCNHSKATPYAEAEWEDAANNFSNNLQDGNCRYIYDQGNASLEKDLTGGWFDAGDYNKYVTFTIATLHDLLWAYEEYPSAFTDATNIPESGNGIPDLIDELKWELDWMMKMTNSDGTVHIKMGSKNYSENVGYPPSNNTDPRYYGPTCTSASLTVASVFAHAAKVFSGIASLSSYAANLESMAISAWDYVLPHYENGTLEYNCDDGSIVSGDTDMGAEQYQEAMIAAAIYLFDLTGNSAYNEFVKDNYTASLVFGVTANDPSNPATYNDDWWDINYSYTKDAYLHYGQIAGHDMSVAEAFYDSFQAMINNDWENFYGIDDTDLYRAYLPSYFLGWGSNSSQAHMGIMNALVPKYGLDNGMPGAYLEKATAHLHFIHGVNPLGISYLSNMYGKGADRCVEEIYHTWFQDGSQWDNLQTGPGPAPGFVPGGPNHTYSGFAAPPSGQPYLKAYANFNDVPSKSWEVTEPAIYYQAAYIRLLANVMALDPATTSTAHLAVSDFCIELYPNPTNQYFVLQGTLSLYNIDILDASGQVVQTIATNSDQEIIDISQLGSGLYFVRVVHQTKNQLHLEKIIKE